MSSKQLQSEINNLENKINIDTFKFKFYYEALLQKINVSKSIKKSFFNKISMFSQLFFKKK
jgi:hypothetical protein